MHGRASAIFSITLLLASARVTLAAEAPVSSAQNKSAVDRWASLADGDQKLAVDALKSFADDASRRVKVPLDLKEGRFFLFYSDVPADVATSSIKLLDETYLGLSALFGVPADENIWRGKAAVFVFSKQTDYRRFEKTVHDTNPAKAAGMCHCLPDGDVHIAFYRQEDEKEFAHVLVHETVHGFLHRLKTPAEMPSWLDEGLAETIACKLSPQSGRAERTLDYARRGVALNGGPGTMLDAEQIERWQYPVAQIMTEYLMERDKEAFAHFICDIKTGEAWEAGLKERFHLTRGELVREFEVRVERSQPKPSAAVGALKESEK